MDLLTSDGESLGTCHLQSGTYHSHRVVAELQVGIRADVEKILTLHPCSISAVMMQIRLAISNLEPRPARLAHDWNKYAYIITFYMTILNLRFLGHMM